jgi:ABC-type hemin transport system substrate-binding protein
MRGVGTDELIEAVGEGNISTLQWRKPLSIEEVAQMAPTAEVRERKGKP